MENRFAENTPETFWCCLASVSEGDWAKAALASMPILETLPAALGIDEIPQAILGEGQFGLDHWRLGPMKRIYYQFVRPFLPLSLRTPLRTALMGRQRNGSLLHWPIESRFARFQFATLAHLLEALSFDSIPFVHFWPHHKIFAFILTHDIESETGQRFVRKVAELEAGYGFHSSFNFVAEGYPIDHDLIDWLKTNGFEVGLHGLKHDGKLFASKKAFTKQAGTINGYLKQWSVAGFRSPMTHRNPEWMQLLDMEYDSSFFDTDPYEPIPGGTMSIWPFQLGRFIELPYTLVQDHTLRETLGETTPRMWDEKVDFIRQFHGMALMNTHPDYLRDPHSFAIYEQFLCGMRQRQEYWHALPKDVADWWRRRSRLDLKEARSEMECRLPGASIGTIYRTGQEIEIRI